MGRNCRTCGEASPKGATVSKPENVKCPDCDGPMVARTSAHGKFWGCKAYPKCRGTRNSLGDAPRRSDAEADGSESVLPSQQRRERDRRRWGA